MSDHLKMHGGEIPWRPSPNHSARTAGVSLIVLHSTGGAFAGALSWMTQKKSRVSAHFLISRGGAVVQLVELSRAAWHAGKSAWKGRANCNAFSIGIEMEHVDGQQDWPAAQVRTAAELCRLLLDRYPGAVITGHANIAPGRKVDPRDFTWEQFRSYLQPAPAVVIRDHRIAARVIESTLYAPARELVEWLGHRGKWNGMARQYLVDGAGVAHDAPWSLVIGTRPIHGTQIDASLWVPARATVEALGHAGTWNPNTLEFTVTP